MALSAQVSHVVFDLMLIAGGQAIILTVIGKRLGLASIREAAVVVGASVAVVMIFLYAIGCYRHDALLHRSLALSRIATALALACPVLILALHNGFSIAFPASPVFLSVSRCVTIVLVGLSISLCAAVLSHGINLLLVNLHAFRRRVLVVGNQARAHYAQRLGWQHGSTLELHFVSDYEAFQSPAVADRNAIADLVARLQVDEVVVSLDDSHSYALEDLLNCKARGIPVTSFNRFVEHQTGRFELDWLDLRSLIGAPGFQFRLSDDVLKRAFDVLFSVLALVVTFPALILAMAAIKLDSAGPVIYRQQRITQGGRVFWLYKLRTMRVDAERNGPKWASVKDPRITRVGSYLRRTRLDEIPQLINIIFGDMSVVGPRPERPVFVEMLQKELPLYHLRHTLRAGLTGWAQVNYRYGASFEDSRNKLEYDLYYIKNFSLIRDIGIILQTIRVVFWPDGVR